MNNPASPSRVRVFSTLFLIEMWERFGYYGMQVLLVVFMVESLGFAEARANLTIGAFAAMVYATPLLGGWIGDRVLGARRTALLGAIGLMAGYALLSVPWSRVVSSDRAGPLLFFSLAVIAISAGLFKPNPQFLVSRLYEGDRSRLDGAFTLYYMAVNVGAVLSQSLTPWIRVHYGWHLAFFACALGLVLGVLQFTLQWRLVRHLGSEPDFQALRLGRLLAVIGGALVLAVLAAIVIQNVTIARAVVWASGAAILALFGVLIARAARVERSGLIATLLLTVQAMLFFVFYEQTFTSLTLFALHNVRLDFLGYHVPPEQFQVLNPFWITVASPLLAVLYGWLGRRGRDPSVAGKFACGFVLLALGFFVFAISGRFASDGRVSPWWMIWGYLLQSVGELLISALGVAMVARYIAPARRGLIIGAWFLASGIAQYIGSFVANYASVPVGTTSSYATLPLYVRLFTVLGWVAVAGVIAALLMLPLLRRLDATHGGGAAGGAGAEDRVVAALPESP
ncbi:MAG TPA: oligopeptide:H+ symporter [Steroidobacteraceae bacterium]|jgi:POT family proton-dependent oligopeptide transporter|nr:oligopeptide:H+ symporter [Steroidobacteraceae bacterium]